MKVQYDPVLVKRLKKVDVRIRKSFKQRLKQFEIDPNNSQLNNHVLKKEWEGFRSIDITSDWRAVYQEIHEADQIIAYFVALGTHEELYKREK